MTSKPLISLAIFEDHNLFRKMLIDFLSSTQDYSVVVEASSVPDLLSKLRRNHVDILIMDPFVQNDDENILPVTLRKEFPDLKILVLSICADSNVISKLLESGIYGYVTKADDPDELIRAITAISKNKIFRSKLLTEALYRGMLNSRQNYGNRDVRLNDREIRILNLLWEEKTSKEIAQEVFLSVRSVEKIRQDIKEKLNVKSTVGIFKYAIDKKLIGRSSSPLS